MWIQAGLREDHANMPQKISFMEFHRGDIDRDLNRRQTHVLPGLSLMTGLGQHPTTNRHHESALFRDGNKIVRGHEAEVRMAPANERFDAGDSSRLQVYFRLKVQGEFVSVQRM